jgi:prepilin-type N-terminal cleavage/methylation domain-containing protein
MSVAKSKTAFSLIELSIVILIISILAAGAISVSGIFLVGSKNKLTQQRIETIYKAIGIYLAKEHRLPCPAPINLSKSSLGYGVESGSVPVTNVFRDCDSVSGVYNSNLVNSKVVYGMVPVNSLGLSDQMAEDGFGSKFSYIVHESLTIPNYSDSSGGSDGFSYYDDESNLAETITIYQLPSTNTITKIVFAIISHGQNKLGSFNANSTIQNSTSGIDTQESYSALSNISDIGPGSSATFGNNIANNDRVTFTSINSSSDSFDDVLFYKSRDEIISDFKLDYLYFCDSSDDGYEVNYNNAYNGQIVYRSTSCSTPNASITPSKECTSLGSVWTDVVTCP